jgi:FMN phosphatase YigB (HAD superfamily)
MRVAIVHYHLDPGGVTSVIQLTSKVLTAAGIQYVIVVGGEGVPPQSELIPIRRVEGLGYLSETAPLTAAALTDSLRTAATEALGAPPDVWHFNNHSLGKNRLIADVVALLAEAGERLVLHLHDLAEDGRPQNYPLIANCPKLYPISLRIRYAFLNSRDRQTFTTAGLRHENSVLLPNPIAVSASLHDLAVGSSPLLFAPIRGIRRKNIGELVLLSALAPAGTRVAISRAPLNPEALPIHENWRKFAGKHRLPIGFDVVDHFTPAAGSSADFESWLSHASHIVTTSVAEGFGLPFLESIAWEKPLIGRDLPHLTTDHGIGCGHLYQRILIPVDWIDLTILESYLTTTLERNHRLYRRPLAGYQIAGILKSLVHDGMVDFGNLPEPLQQGIIERLAEKSDRRVPLVEIDGDTRPLEDWLADVVAIRTPSAKPDQLAEFSPGRYGEKLSSIYQDLSRQPEAPVRFLPPERILTACLAPERFHFLLSAPEAAPVPVKFRAVIFDIYGTLLIAPAGGVKPDPFVDPFLREILRQAGHTPPASPSTELHAAVLRHHAAAGTPYPEIDLRVLWREILGLEPGTEITPLVVELEAAWHPAQPMPGASAFIGRLSRAGISLGLLSNAQCNTLPSLGDVADLFAPELILLSYQHGTSKPAPELFQMLANRLAGRNISPVETLYIGNDPLHDIAPAAAAGFRTALFVGHPDSMRPGECQADITFRKWSELSVLF